MEDVFKKVLYAGAGLAALATEKVQATVDELVDKGKLSDTEGKKILDDFFKNTEAKKDEFEDKLKSATEDVIEKFDFVKKNGTIKEILDRLDKIEAEMGKTEKKTTSRTSKKAASAS